MKRKDNKKIILIVILVLIIGLILGYVLVKGKDSKLKDNATKTEIGETKSYRMDLRIY